MKGKILLALLVIFLLAAGAYAASVFINYSEGYRAGQIIKMSKKGVLFKTNEGQLNTGGGFGSDGDMTSSIWNFSVARSDKDVLKKIEHAVDGQYRVKLRYKEKFFKHGWRGDTKYFVFDVEEMENPKGNQQRNPANQNAAPGANNPNAIPGANNPNAIPGANNRAANPNAALGRADKLEKRMTIEEARKIIANEKRGPGGKKILPEDQIPVPR